jgi:hypothetical protein
VVIPPLMPATPAVVTPAVVTPIEPPSPAPAPPAPTLAVSIDNPAGQTTGDAMANFSGRVWNFTGAVQVTWQTDHGAAGTATGGSLWSVTGVPLQTGPNIFSVTAIDAAHDSAAQSVLITREAASAGPDTVAPQIVMTSPASTIVATSEASITIQGVASDNVGVTSVQWQAPGGRQGTATGTTAWSIVVPLYVGTNPVTVNAYDAAGNTRFVAVTVVRQ